MRKLPIFLTAGALALAGTAAFASGGPNLHTMTLKLPDGGVAKIEYSGDIPPKVDIRSGAPTNVSAFSPDFAFAGFPEFTRIEAAMDRQMDDMLRQARIMMAAPMLPNTPFKTSLGGAPGDDSRWFVSTANRHDFCARSVEVTVINGKRSVRSDTEGNCGSSRAASDTSPHSSAVSGKSI